MSGVRLLIRAWMVAGIAALLIAPSAQAITAKRARAVALRTLTPQKLPGPYVLFGLPAPLARGTVVTQGGPTRVVARQTLAVHPLSTRAWLFWLDQAPNAAFVHPSRLLLVDDRGGRVIRDEGYAWWPLVDGRRPAFVASPTGYDTPRYRVSARGDPAAPPPPPAPARAAQVDLPTGATQFTGDCIVTIGDRTDPLLFTGDFGAVNLFAAQHGIRKLDAMSVADLTTKVDQLHAGKPPCVDVVVWVLAHGYPADRSGFVVPSGPHAGQPIPTSPQAAVQVQTKVRTADGKVSIRSEQLTSGDLRRLFRAHPDMTFKLVVMACFSGRWWELSDVANLRVIATSSRRDQMSFGNFPTGQAWQIGHQENAVVTTTNVTKTNTIESPAGASPFTTGVVTALDQWAASPERTDDLGQGLSYAIAHMRQFNYADQIGWTVSGGIDNTAKRPHAPIPGATPPPTQPPPATGGDFSANAVMSYRHIGPGSSEVCVLVSTSPRRPGGTASVVTLGPGVTGGGRQVVTLGPDGSALVRVPINSYGGYSTEVTVDDGDRAASSDAITVNGNPGTCPPP